MKWPSWVLIDCNDEAVEGGSEGSMGGTETSHGAAVVGGWTGIGPIRVISGYRV